MLNDPGGDMPGVANSATVPVSGLWEPKGLVAVLDTNVLVSVRLSRAPRRTVSREIFDLAGLVYDSFTSPAILEEVELVLARPKFGIPIGETRCWLDVFLRHSRQVDPCRVPGDFAAALGNDRKDNHVLKTALAVNLHEEGQKAVEESIRRDGCYIVSADSDFEEGRVVWGWRFIRPENFYHLLRSLAA